MSENTNVTQSQPEVERIVQQALTQARAEWDAEKAQAVANAEHLAAMTDAERAAYNLSRREADLAERERMLLERELRAMAVERLTERGLPAELANTLPYADEAKCLAALDALESAFRKAVQSAVDERLRGGVPVSGANASTDSMTDAEYYQSVKM